MKRYQRGHMDLSGIFSAALTVIGCIGGGLGVLLWITFSRVSGWGWAVWSAGLAIVLTCALALGWAAWIKWGPA